MLATDREPYFAGNGFYHCCLRVDIAKLRYQSTNGSIGRPQGAKLTQWR